MLDRAEQRSKVLGISSASKIPLSEYNQESINTSSISPSKKSISSSPTKTSFSSPSKKIINRDGTMTRTTNTKIVKNITEREDVNDSKENVDLAVEINITTGPNIQVIIQNKCNKIQILIRLHYLGAGRS